MNTRARAFALSLATLLMGASGFAQANTTASTVGKVATAGQPAPGFSARDTAGRTVSLADFKGRTVVLEWMNPGCPYVQKHYRSANMQGTQREATGQGVVWLAVNSTGSEHDDYLAPAALADWMKEQRAAATATLLDADGRIGRAYGARTTPHMVVIDAKGTLVYAGAIDSKASARISDIASATNHVKAALAETLAGRPVSVPLTRGYGCAVKYTSGA